jgi:hypothetical protein
MKDIETAVIEPRTKSDVRIPKFPVRIVPFAKPNERDIISLLEEGLMSGSASIDEVLNVLRRTGKFGVPPSRGQKNVIVDAEDLEDAFLLTLMKEREDDESVGLNEVMDFLNQ